MTIKTKYSQHPILDAFLECREALIFSITKLSARQEDVDDILQETYLRTYTAHQKQPIKSPKGYLFVVSRNLVYKRLSRSSKEINTEIDDALLDVQSESAGVDDEIHYQLKLDAFNEALKTLPENARRAILMRKIYGMSHKEIARKLDVSISSVEKYISTGIKQCAASLSARGYADESSSDAQR